MYGLLTLRYTVFLTSSMIRKIYAFIICIQAVTKFYMAKQEESVCIQDKNRLRRDIRHEHMNDLLLEKNSRKDSTINHVAYFSGNEVIRYNNLTFHLDNFTIDCWLKLEGGQTHQVAILTIFNHCTILDVSAVVIGLRASEDEKEMNIFFSLKTEYSKEYTMLLSHKPIPVHKWIHVAAVYDGKHMELYINQAKVDVNHEQSGPFLSNIFYKCTTLEVGGTSAKHTAFRGTVDKLSIWNRAKSHEEIVDGVRNHMSTTDSLLLYEDFRLDVNTENKSRYYGVTGELPKIVVDRLTSDDVHDIEIEVPNCGETICDNPEIIRNYANYTKLFLRQKTLRYRIVNIANDDGSNPTLSKAEILQKDRKINKVFERYNITWKLSIHVIKNSYLRNKTVVIKCYGNCENERDQCKLNVDIPNCTLPCDTSTKLNNKICNPECNRIIAGGSESDHWDGGDCCNPLYTNVFETCFDRSSPNRAYITDAELKNIINLSNRLHLNLIPVKLRAGMLGKATFPWLPNIYGKTGGITMSVETFRAWPLGNENDIIHELGHILGLWHVHKGVSDLTTCSDECAEKNPSLIHGDLCDDTNPTPLNLHCIDEVVINDKCGHQTYRNTPYRNFMGYSSGLCSNQFTLQQKARMHCYIDQMYQQWETDVNTPSTIPLQPRVLNSNTQQVEITWMPPIGYGNEYIKHGCHRCEPGSGILKQYASKAHSPQDEMQTKYLSTEAVGPPNELHTCEASESTRVWYPMTGCGAGHCMLEVSFAKIVVPTGIKIWLSFNSKDSIEDIRLLHPDLTVTSLGPASTQCNVPYTKRITTTKLVSTVQIYLSNPKSVEKTAIDAVQLISEKQHTHCKKCRKLKLRYNVYRLPAFKDAVFTRVTGVRFIDNDIEMGKEYEYQVQAESGLRRSGLSLPLKFKLAAGYCGDGIVENSLGEQCDDANVRNGDGCNINCQIETVFNCKQQPSLCYKHDRDGICEHFEKESSNHDCGFYTPNGFTDQWASDVFGNERQSDETCPENAIAGKPCISLKCVSGNEDLETTNAWRSCGDYMDKYWVESTYQNEVIAAAVVIYLASDGIEYPGQRNGIEIELKDTNGVYHKATNKETSVSCKTNPMSVHVMHDMTQPVFKTVGVRISFNASAAQIGISAIALRSAETDYYHKCQLNELYDPRTKKCRPYKSEALPCKPFKVTNAKFNCTGYEDGDHCYSMCNHGYRPRDFTSHCSLGKWVSSDSCQPVECGIPRLKHSVANCLTTTFGSVCTFTCQSNAHLIGLDTRLTCQADGTWRKSDAHCYVTCSKPIHVDNSDLYTTDTFPNECSDGKKTDFEMGTRCRYRCKLGHRPVRHEKGTMNGGNTINILCNDEGEWKQDGTCEKVTCSPLSTMSNYLYKCSDGNRFESVCSTNCLGTKKLPYKVRCKHNGEWSSPFDFCGNKGKCSAFPSIVGLDTTSCKQFTVGSVCRPQCKRRIDGVVPDIVIKGLEDVKDAAIYCMPNKEWKPKLSELDCVNPCSGVAMNDKVCDCINNNKHCLYDGGDCCRKSLSDTVMFWDSVCPCIDPTALEHLDYLEKNPSPVERKERRKQNKRNGGC